VVVANYLLATLTGWSGWTAGLVVAAVCPLMISDYKAYKTDTSHLLAGGCVVLATAFVVCFELGYL